MTVFTEHLKAASMAAAKVLRSDVKSEDGVSRYREMRQEANFVAEVYHLLRSTNERYIAEDFFLEYLYPKKVKVGSKEKRLKPDLIYGGKDGDEVVEFRVFWDGDVEEGSSHIKAIRNGIITKYFAKLLSYRELPDKIASLTLVVAYLGPEIADDKTPFDLDLFKDSVIASISNYDKLKRERKPEVQVIVC